MWTFSEENFKKRNVGEGKVEDVENEEKDHCKHCNMW